MRPPYRKLEVEGSLLGKRVLKIKENDWAEGLGTFWNPIFERSEGMNGVWVDVFGNPFFQKWRGASLVSENCFKSSKTFHI